eukprot:977641-Pyramimonas_sp.AAC.1
MDREFKPPRRLVERQGSTPQAHATRRQTAHLAGSTLVAAHPLGPQRARRRHMRSRQISGPVHLAQPRRG